MAIAFQMSEPGDKAAPKTARPVFANPVKPPEPPPVVAEAPAVVPATPEPAQPVSPPPVRKEKPARKPSRVEPKVHKPSLPKHAAPAARTGRTPMSEPPTPPKAAVVEERAVVSMNVTPKAPPGPTALVMFAISPWGEIFVDGKSAGVSPPLSELELAPGHHRIEIRNGGFKPYLETFELEANQTVRIKYKFKER
jgi:eukaryotic-like serine/threonine-protein kinase